MLHRNSGILAFVLMASAVAMLHRGSDPAAPLEPGPGAALLLAPPAGDPALDRVVDTAAGYLERLVGVAPVVERAADVGAVGVTARAKANGAGLVLVVDAAMVAPGALDLGPLTDAASVDADGAFVTVPVDFKLPIADPSTGATAATIRVTGATFSGGDRGGGPGLARSLHRLAPPRRPRRSAGRPRGLRRRGRLGDPRLGARVRPRGPARGPRRRRRSRGRAGRAVIDFSTSGAALPSLFTVLRDQLRTPCPGLPLAK